MPVATDPRDELSAFLDDELSDEERAELEEAIASDPSLRAEHDALTELVGDLQALGDIEAPPNFLAGVLARVDAGELMDAPLFGDHAPDEAEKPGLQVVPDAPEPETEVEPVPDNVVRIPWWVKGPALTAVAALLLVGIGYQIRGPMLGAPPASESVAMRPVGDVAPMPTGAVAEDPLADSMDMDAVAVAEEAPPAERLRMDGPAGEAVAVGGAGSGASLRAAPPAAPKRQNGIREVTNAPPPGVVMGNFDRAELGYSPEPEPEAPAEAEADAVADAGDLIPEPAPGALAMAPAAEAAAGDRPAMAAVAKLVTTDPQSIMQIRDTAEARGWGIRFISPAGGPVVLSDAQTEQVLELVVPGGAEAAAQGVLEGQGTFSFSTTPAASDSSQSRLRVTIVFSR